MFNGDQSQQPNDQRKTQRRSRNANGGDASVSQNGRKIIL